jgi:branched-chain amino acid transport system ATP-binding protein
MTLRVESLSKAFGGVKAVRHVSFSVAAGEIVALIGPNGAGKSTCFNLINGQLKPDAGECFLSQPERRITGLGPEALFHLGVGRTFQITATFGSLTVLENVQLAVLSKQRGHQPGFLPSLKSVGSTQDAMGYARAMALLGQVQMQAQADRAASELAYGDIKRVELAIALANEPSLLLMDEPTAGMAPAERLSLMALTRQLGKEHNIAVLFTEHSMDAVFNFADRILVLVRGELIAQGTPNEIRNNPEVRAAYLGDSLSENEREGSPIAVKAAPLELGKRNP